MSSTVDSSTARERTSAVPDPPTDHAPDELTRLRVVPRRNIGRWIATAVVLVVLAQAINGLVTNPFYAWDRFAYWFARPIILEGLVITLKVTALSAVFGLVGGVVVALGRLSRSPLLQVPSWGFVWLFRSVPIIVLLVFIYNLTAIYPVLGLGIPFGPQLVSSPTRDLLAQGITVAVIALSLNEAAYASEIVRGGILAVDSGQVEAAHALGLSRNRLLRRIVLPQALRAIVPAYVNQLIGLIKTCSLVFYVGVLDIFGAAQSMGSTYPADIVPLLLVATVWYVILTSILSVVQYYVERYYARGAVRTLPPTPRQRLQAGIASLAARRSFRRSVRSGVPA